MARKLTVALLLLLFAPLPTLCPSLRQLSSHISLSDAGGKAFTQEYPAKKPRHDYMSSFLSRNTKPLGLKEDLALKKLMRQPNIKWAIRADVKHILD